MNEIDLAWAAGFFDGEGSVGIYGQPYHRVVANLTQKIRLPLDHFVSIIGIGSVQPRVGKGGHFQWQVAGPKAVDAVKMIEPYLVFKRPQALLAIDFQSRKKRGRSLDGQLRFDLDEADRVQMQALKLKEVSYA